MPMLAHFEERPQEPERRRWARRALLLGVGGNGSGRAEVTIHDLSLTGALLETPIPMLVGAVFDIELPHAGNIEAIVAWNSGEFYGCQFKLPISPAALSAAMLQSTPSGAHERTEVPPDPVEELRQLNDEIEHLAMRMERALELLAKKDQS
jgi:PilZ domain